MHIDEKVLADVRARYGEPTVLQWEGEVTDAEFALAGIDPDRRHDVTFFVFNGPRLALIRKPQYAPEIWRPPGGGVRAGEDFVAGVMREVLEELGVDVELEDYLVASEARFRFGSQTIDWRTHVFSASTDADELALQDEEEIEAARWGTLEELARPLRERLLATGGALWRYRVALHDAAIAALTRRRTDKTTF
jgi:ADP-ribose pyrophosphatase YjhB (NUDIX family)